MNLKPEVVAQLERVLGSVEMLLPRASKPVDWAECHAANWRRHSFSGYLEPVKVTDNTRLEELLGVEEQKEIMINNTKQFLQGLPANNALLWGSRGTGKSSIVKALLNEYAEQGMRIIQVEKEDLIYISEIFAAIEDQPYRFILLCDDLTFETGELAYKMLKSALDGSVYSAPDNVLIYVTSNRRYLLPELFMSFPRIAISRRSSSVLSAGVKNWVARSHGTMICNRRRSSGAIRRASAAAAPLTSFPKTGSAST